MVGNEQSAAWYYEINGERRGPVQENAILQFYRTGVIRKDALVWAPGYADWRPLAETGLLHEVSVGPPPLSGNAVNNSYVWWLAFMPIIGSIIEYIVARALGGGSQSLWFITFFLNVWLCRLDEKRLKKAGYDTSSMGATWFVPAYLFRRAKYLKQNYAYAIMWCVTFAILLIW